MSLFFVHARATFAAASAPANRAKALALLLSVGFMLFCCSLMLVEMQSTDAAPSVMDALLFVLIFGLSTMAVPLWRGLIWSSSGSVVLPIRRRVADAVEGGVFALLTLIPLGALWAVFWSAVPPVLMVTSTVGSSIHATMAEAVRQDPSQDATRMLLQGAIAGGLFLLSAPVAAQLRLQTASKMMWALFALPGLAGIILSAGLSTRQSSAVYITVSLLGVFASVLVLVGATRIARHVARRPHTHGGTRPGRLDRLAVDNRRDLIRSMTLTTVLTLLGWLLLSTLVNQMVDQTLSGNPLQSWWGGLLVILPLMPRLSLLGTQLGIRMTDAPDAQAWSILPVHPTDLRRRMLAAISAPLAVGLLIDIAFVTLQPDPLDWLYAIAKVNVAASVICMVVLPTVSSRTRG